MNETTQNNSRSATAGLGRVGRYDLRILVTTAAMLLTTTACTKTTSIAVSMEYKPTATVQASGFPVTAGTKLYIEPIVDERAVKDRVGEYREEDELSLPANAEGTPVPDFIRHAMIEAIAGLGIRTVEDAAAANRIMTVTLDKCWTNEQGKVGPTSVYESEIRTKIRMTDDAGTVVCEGVYSGTNERFGGDHNEDNYQEGLSDAVVDLITRLGASPAFQKAIVIE